MKRESASRVPQEEKSKSSHSEERAVEERRRRRREWLIKQELDREHEKMKKKRILEYEMERARKKGLSVTRSKNKSKSPPSQHRRTPPPSTSKQLMSEKVKGTTGKIHIFKGPEGTQVSTTELQRIKVNVSRNIPARTTSSELQRDIIDPEDVIVKRREGEGAKPIFERDELKKAVGSTEIEEYRKVISIDHPSSVSEDRVQLPKQCSIPSSPLRSGSHSPQCTSSWNIRTIRKDSKTWTRTCTGYEACIFPDYMKTRNIKKVEANISLDIPKTVIENIKEVKIKKVTISTKIKILEEIKLIQLKVIRENTSKDDSILVREIKNKKDGNVTLIEVIDRPEMKGPIGKDQEKGLENTEKDPENKGYHHLTILNKYQFLFIMETFNQGH